MLLHIVLTITTLLSSTNVNLPPTAYPKAIGVFLAGCFVFTFLAFLEYSAASYLHRRRSFADGAKASICSDSPPPNLVEACNAQGTTKQGGRRFTLVAIGVKDTTGKVKPSAVDLYSRIVFPVAFVLFQVIYWLVLFLSLDPLPNDVTMLERNSV